MKQKIKKLKKIWKLKIKACYYILSGKYKHFVILNIDRENMIKVLEDETFNMDILYSQINQYVYTKMIKMFSDSHNDIDMVCAKAEFEADAIDYKRKKENQ